MCIKYLLLKPIQPTFERKEFAMKREVEVIEVQSSESGNFAGQIAPKMSTFFIHFSQS
jgi:hypothetical protein